MQGEGTSILSWTVRFFNVMFDGNGLMEWYKTIFILSNRLQPSEIERMTLIDMKVYVMMYNDWIRRRQEQK